MSEQRDKAFVRASIDQGLSSLEGNPFLAQRILAQAQGKDEIVVKKKISVSLILVAILLVLMTSVAVAAGLGLFGELSFSTNNDERLPQLEQVAESVAFTLTTDDGVVVEIDQAYYEGNRVFMSYRLSGNLSESTLHEGQPEAMTWDTELENWICAQEFFSEYPSRQEAIKWLDGQSQHWTETRSVTLHDGLYLADGTYADIIGGDLMIQADGSIIGWKECEIPDDHLSDTLTFKAVLFRTVNIEWQDGTTYRAHYTRGENTEIPFTLKRNEHFSALTGVLEAVDYQAVAALEQGQIDMKGTVRVACPVEWSTAMNDWEEHGVDYIVCWSLYQNGQLISSHGTEGYGFEDANTACYMLLYPRMDDLDSLTLVPEYLLSGEHADEAMAIQINPDK